MIVATARDAADLVGPLLAGKDPQLVVLHLDSERRLLALDRQPLAAEAASPLPAREIIAEALRLGSAGLVVARSRAGGDAEPGAADIEATRRLADAAAALDIRLHDHLIFAGGGCRSFRELGLL
jgi:DNA repair protein RadC